MQAKGAGGQLAPGFNTAAARAQEPARGGPGATTPLRSHWLRAAARAACSTQAVQGGTPGTTGRSVPSNSPQPGGEAGQAREVQLNPKCTGKGGAQRLAAARARVRELPRWKRGAGYGLGRALGEVPPEPPSLDNCIF